MERADFDEFLLGLFLAVEAQVECLKTSEQHDEWADLDAGLMLKLWQTLTTIRDLQQPRFLVVQGRRSIEHVDFQSIGALTRMAVENCLVSDWLFGRGEPDKKELHRMVWKYGGLCSLASALPTTCDARKAAEDAHRQAEELQPCIEAGLRKHYPKINLEKGTGKDVLAGKWMKLAWVAEKAELSGHHKSRFKVIYDQLSGYAHSNFVSARQALAATSLADQQEMAHAISIQLMPVLAHTLRYFIDRCPAAMRAVGASEFMMLIEGWSELAEHQEMLLRNAWVKPDK